MAGLKGGRDIHQTLTQLVDEEKGFPFQRGNNRTRFNNTCGKIESSADALRANQRPSSFPPDRKLPIKAKE